MSNLTFKDREATRVYESYIKQVIKVVKALPDDEQRDLLMELESHIYESLQRETAGSEVERIVAVIGRMGDPYETFFPLVADRKLTQATRTFNPAHVLKALSLNISNGFMYVMFSVLYLLLFAFVFFNCRKTCCT